MKIIGYQYHSCFGPYIEKFIEEKKASGFTYETEEWKLKHFDLFCAEKAVTDVCLSRKLVQEWGTLRESEALSTCSARTSVLRQFALFLLSEGIPAYIPSRFYKTKKAVVHILTDAEIHSLFEEIDLYVPAISTPCFERLAMEYKVIFRLIYCCGLRISEARMLLWENVNLKEGVLRILQSKGRKDRLVYMADDLVALLYRYRIALNEQHHCLSVWVFPAREPGKCLSSVTIGAKFRQCWGRTPYASGCDKSPTVHSLRHSFVVKRMNQWMEEGVSLKEMLPFLSKYLGHTSPDETFYYYHQVYEAFRIIRDRDKTSAEVIPEVMYDG